MDTRAQNFQHDLPSAGPISNSWEFPPNIVKQLESQLQKLVDKAFERVSRRSIPPTGSPGRSLDKWEVLARTGGSSATLYNRLNANSAYYQPDFPRPFKEGRRSFWSESEIDAYCASRLAARDGGQEVQ